MRWTSLLPLAALSCATTAVTGTAREDYRAAVEARQGGKADEAMADLRAALRLDPGLLDAWRALVQLYSESERLSEIVSELEQRSALSPGNAPLHYALGLAYFAQASKAAGPAVAELRKAAALQPKEAEYPFRLGVALLESEEYADAVIPLKHAVELRPEEAKYHVPLGLCLARLGDRKAALEEFRALLMLKPTAKDVVLAQSALQRLDDPLRNLPRAEADNFQKGMAWMNRADAPQQAIDTFQDILDRYPDLASVQALIGLCYERLDDLGPAVEHLRRAIELAPDDADPYLYLGDLYYAKEKPQQAQELYQKAVERNPLLDEAYRHLGEMAVLRGDADAALQNYRALVALRPDDPDAHKHMAQGYELAGSYDLAEKELKAVIEKNPKDVDAQMRLGYLYLALRKRVQEAPSQERYSKLAVDSFQKVLDVQPENAAASRAIRELQRAP